MFRSAINKIILIAVIFISAVFHVKYGARSTTFYGDALGYYLYLPATFIYHNTDMMYELPKDKGIDAGVVWYAGIMKEHKSQTGKEVNQYTYGIAFMEMPFFLIAHLIEKIRGGDANGFSITYQVLIKISAIFYTLLGLLLIFRTLTNYFTPAVSFLGIAIIFIGSNLFWFTLYQAGMSHTPLFFLYALLIYLTVEVHKQQNTVTFIALGITMGLITVIRPSDILSILIPVLYNVYNKATVHQKLVIIKANPRKILFLIVAFFLLIIPQLLYWKITTGKFIYYSYGDQTFNWSHPKIIQGLFYFRNGWLAYSPVMIFSLMGFLLYKKFKEWALCAWLIWPVYVYIIYSWYCYNYINGLGSRPMIHLYPLLAFPLAAFIQFISTQKPAVKAVFCILCLFFISLNLGFSRLCATGILQSDESNMVYNFHVFFQPKLTYEDLTVYEVGEVQPDTNKITKLCTLACNNFGDSTSDHFVRDTLGNRYCYQMKNEDYSPEISVRYHREQFKDAKWFKCSGRFMYPHTAGYGKHILALNVPDKLLKYSRIENKINDHLENYHLDSDQPDKWGTVSYYARIPKKMKDGDVIKLFLWSYSKSEVFIENMCLELYK